MEYIVDKRILQAMKFPKSLLEPFGYTDIPTLQMLGGFPSIDWDDEKYAKIMSDFADDLRRVTAERQRYVDKVLKEYPAASEEHERMALRVRADLADQLKALGVIK